jgi:hypothetical protein
MIVWVAEGPELPELGGELGQRIRRKAKRRRSESARASAEGSVGELRAQGQDKELEVVARLEKPVVLPGLKEEQISGDDAVVPLPDAHDARAFHHDIDLRLLVKMPRTAELRLMAPHLRAAAFEHRKRLK